MKSSNHVARLRDTLLNETLLWLGFLALPLVALSLARIPTMGWRPVFGLQLLCTVLLWLSWFLRRRITYTWRLGFVLSIVSVVGMGGYIQLGPAATSGQFLLLSLVIAVLFMQRRAALGCGLVILAGLLLTAWGAVSGALQFKIDYPSYAHAPLTWTLIIVAFIGYGGTVAYLVWRLVHSLIERGQNLMQVNADLAERTEESRVRQIELETQNENMRLAQLELEAAQAR